MKVKRIVANISTPDIRKANAFYHDILGLEILMDQEWIVTYGSHERAEVQIIVASEGGSGTNLPDLSIEVDDVNSAFEQIKLAGFEIVYGIADEPWGVRRFYVIDPFGKLINILQHL